MRFLLNTLGGNVRRVNNPVDYNVPSGRVTRALLVSRVLVEPSVVPGKGSGELRAATVTAGRGFVSEFRAEGKREETAQSRSAGWPAGRREALTRSPGILQF